MKKIFFSIIIILLIISNITFANQNSYKQQVETNKELEQVDNEKDELLKNNSKEVHEENDIHEEDIDINEDGIDTQKNFDEDEKVDTQKDIDIQKDNSNIQEKNVDTQKKEKNDNIDTQKEEITKNQSNNAIKNISNTKVTPVKSIEDGEYEIRTVENNNLIFDIGGGSIDSGAKLQLWYDSNVEQQRFIVKYIGDGYYKITVRKSNKILDVTGAGTKNGTSVQQFDNNNTDAQKWIIKETEDGYYNIVSKCNGLYATAKKNDVGKPIQMYEYNNSNSQKFIFDKVLKEKGKQSIEDGEYEIRTAVNDNLIFDIGGGSIDSGAKLQLWYDSNVEQQRFIVKYMGDGFYKITIRKSNKILDVSGAGIQNGTSVQQFDNNNTDAQRWIIKETEDGYYNIISKCNGLYATAKKNDVGKLIQMYECNNSNSQKFIFDKVLKEKGKQSIEDGEYEIRTAVNDNLIFDISGGSIDSGAKLQLWYDSNVEQQRFIVKYMGDGFYKITIRKSNRILDVSGAGIQNGTSVQQFDNNDTDAQRWIIKETGDGYYNIISKCNGLYATAKKNDVGKPIQMYECNNSNSQKFKFEKIVAEKGKQSLKDGVYEIKTAINKNKNFDIAGGSTIAGAKLQIWDDADVPQQRFILEYIGNGYYKITVKKSGKVLDVSGRSYAKW